VILIFYRGVAMTLNPITIFVINGLDQDVTVQIKGNRIKSEENAANIGASFTVPAGKSDFRTLVCDSSGFLPFVFVELSCSVTPTSGAVDVYMINPAYGEEKIVDSLEIRDTETHNPSTDSDRMKIGWWRLI